MTDWTEAGRRGRIAEVLDKTTPTGQAYQKRVFTYVTTDDGIEHVQTQTLRPTTRELYLDQCTPDDLRLLR